MYRKCCDCKKNKDIETCFSKNKYMSQGREYYCKECKKIRRQKWLETGNNYMKKLASVRAYKTTDKFKQNRNKKLKNRPIKDRISHNLRSRIRKAFLGFYKDQTTIKLLGCSTETLIQHLSKQFKPNMSLDNYGAWHIDHIIPLSSATNKLELEKLCHYTNLQPLWARDNLKKSNKNIKDSYNA